MRYVKKIEMATAQGDDFEVTVLKLSADYVYKTKLLCYSCFQECPEGVVHEDCFKDIYAKFFPHGSKFTIIFL